MKPSDFGLIALLGLAGAACASGPIPPPADPAQPLPPAPALVQPAPAEEKLAPAPPSSRASDVSAANSSTSSQEELGPFFCYVEVLTADRPSVYGYMAPRGCMPSGSFQRGERMVFRFEVVDLATGKKVTAREAADIALRVPYHADVPAEYKQRGEGRVSDAPWTWDVCWDVPLDYPQGTLDYAIAITLQDGRQGTWKPPAFIDPGRGIDTRPQIIEQTDDIPLSRNGASR